MAEAQRDEIAKLEALYAANPEGHVFTHLAEAYRKAGELDHAREILQEGLQRHPDSASAHVVLGRVEQDRADREAAHEAFSRALSLDGGNLIALRYLGELALERGDRGEAVARFRELLSRDLADATLQQRVQELEREQSAAPATPPEAGEVWEAPAAVPEEPGAEPWAYTEEAFRQPEQPAEASEPAQVEWYEPAATEPEPAAAAEPWESEEPEFLSIEFDEAEPAFASLETDAPEDTELEFLSLDEESAEAPGEYLVLDAPEYEGAAPDFPAPWLEAELAEPEAEPGEVLAEQAQESVAEWAEAAPETEPAPTVESPADSGELAELEPAAEGSASSDWVAELEPAAEDSAPPAEPAFSEAAASVPAPPELEAPAPVEEPPLPTAAEAELVIASAFEAPAEAIPPLEELTPLGDMGVFGEPETALPEAAAEPPPEAAAGLFTETMAELYRSQGFPDRAAEVYRWLLARDPENSRLQQLLAESEAALATGVGVEPASGREWLQDVQSVESAFTGGAGAAAHQDSPYVWTGAGEEPVSAGPKISAYFRELLAWRPAAAEAVTVAEGELVLDEVIGDEGEYEPEPAPPTEDGQELMPWEFAEPPALAATQVEPTAEAPPGPPASEAEGEGEDDQQRAGEVEAEDEDLEMFRSWLQSLKK